MKSCLASGTQRAKNYSTQFRVSTGKEFVVLVSYGRNGGARQAGNQNKGIDPIRDSFAGFLGS